MPRWGLKRPKWGTWGDFPEGKKGVLGGWGASTHREGGRAEKRPKLNKSQMTVTRRA